MPLSMDEASYGQCLIIKEEKWYLYKPDIMIKRSSVKENLVENDVYGITPEGTKIKHFTFIDECVGGGCFKRYLNGGTYEIINGQVKKALIPLSEKPKLEPLKRWGVEKVICDIPIITMDIETFLEGVEHVPYAVG
jgi:hypothetical protein